MKVSIDITEADDGGTVADMLTRLAGMFRPATTVATPVIVYTETAVSTTQTAATTVETAVTEAPKTRKPRTTKAADPLVAYNAMAAAAGSPVVIEAPETVETELTAEPEPAVEPVAEVTPEPVKAVDPAEEMQALMQKAGFTWLRNNMPAGKMRLRDLTPEETTALRAALIAHVGA